MTSTFQQKLATGEPVLTVEFSPPKGSDIAAMLERVQAVAPYVTAVNVPDCQRAMLKMSSLVASVLVERETGVETIWQLTGRDRNVIALQADLLGGWAMGLRNVLALTGDPVSMGDQADVAKQVSDVDALRMIDLMLSLNRGEDAAGVPLPKQGTQYCIGAALNPHRMSREAQIHRLKRKLQQGVAYFQTQPVYDVPTVEETMARIASLCDELQRPMPPVLIGMIPPKSADFARFLNQKVVGVSIPPHLIDLLERSADPVQESMAFCLDLMHQFSPWTNSFHVMPVGMEKRIVSLLKQHAAI